MKNRHAKIFRNFYSTPRMAQLELTDGGGPFGFDIEMAIEVDWLINKYKCTTIVETGCHMGDTTDYLSKNYNKLPVNSCDTNAFYVKFSKHRLSSRSNVFINKEDSKTFIKNLQYTSGVPFYYLDAHWSTNWPLLSELRSIKKGIVCIHDFNIEHNRFSFDKYNNIDCDFQYIKSAGNIGTIYINKVGVSHPYPCLQVGRRAGRCYLAIGIKEHFLKACPYIEKMDLPI